MILTGSMIAEAVKYGEISIDPYNPENLNPNSYNYTLGSKLLVNDGKHYKSFDPKIIPDDGLWLQPGVLYLGSTNEKIGSNKYAMSLVGRSSLGRLGMFLQISANLGHTNSNHCWTLEIYVTQRIKVYPNIKIGQVSFWKNIGDVKATPQKYAQYSNPTPSLTSTTFQARPGAR